MDDMIIMIPVWQMMNDNIFSYSRGKQTVALYVFVQKAEIGKLVITPPLVKWFRTTTLVN
jgi:hypothetical protein